MRPFQIFQPTHLFFGKEQQNAFFDALPNFGKRYLIVIGGGTVKRKGYLETATQSLAQRNLDYRLFEGIEPNPEAVTINKAAAFGKAENVDAILALGGGSVMDAAKAIGALIFMNEPDIWPYTLGGTRQGKITGSLPITTIPTTAATASEVTPYAVISHSASQGKAPISHVGFKPLASWLNPEYTTSLSAVTTQDGAADILSHVFENYILGGSESSLTDRYCEGIIETVMQTLPKCLAEPSHYGHRAHLLWASNLALNGYHSAGRVPSAFILHAMEHALSGVRTSLAHGRGLATLFPAYFKWMLNKNRAVDRLALLGQRLFGAHGHQHEQAEQFIASFETWLRANNLYQSLSSLGFTQAELEQAASYCLKTYGSGKNIDVAGDFGVQDVMEIFTMTELQQ